MTMRKEWSCLTRVHASIEAGITLRGVESVRVGGKGAKPVFPRLCLKIVTVIGDVTERVLQNER